MRKKIKNNLHVNHRKRVRQKYLKHGLSVFNDHEILEMLLFYVLPRVDTNDIAHELINKAGSFSGVFDLPYEELIKVKGIKEHSATFIKLIPELSRLYLVNQTDKAERASMEYDDIVRYVIQSFSGMQNESMILFYFDSKMRPIGKEILCEGTFTAGVASKRKTVDAILNSGAANVVIAHNHTTFSVVPSVADIDVTKELYRVLTQLDIGLTEHFVISGDKYLGIVKFAQESKIELGFTDWNK